MVVLRLKLDIMKKKEFKGPQAVKGRAIRP